ncbi:MAG: anhydro-N-acetylmuramic acid kinase [Nitrospirae bacterium]|nr:anhydro-N-acetylmuramic acid kinase [Nitrospirota bacterium]
MAGKKKVMRIIGLMSGTSHDGVDAALVEISYPLPFKGKGAKSIPSPLRGEGQGGGEQRGFFDNITITLLKHIHTPYPVSLRAEIRDSFNGNTELICRLNFRLGEVFSEAVLSLLKKTGFKPEDINAIASHGQTVYHIPPSGRRTGSTLQIGEASVISERTGILTISDFRTADMAAGGQGAPLVPMADYLLFKTEGKVRAVLNIGGIANVTIIREHIDDTVAFDTGPGNSLIDEAMRIWSKGKLTLDFNGSFASLGKPIHSLLIELLSHPFFSKRPPKSTGRETFGTDLAEEIFYRYRKAEPQDIVSTLTHLTAITVYRAIKKFHPDEVILTGGGVKNRLLMSRINEGFKKEGIAVNQISLYGIPPQAKEAVSFAILGYRTLNKLHGNVPSATGAKHKAILGKITISPPLQGEG